MHYDETGQSPATITPSETTGPAPTSITQEYITLTPAEVDNLINDSAPTSIQKQQTIEQLEGKWVKWQGTIQDVSGRYITIDLGVPHFTHTDLHLIDQNYPLSQLNKGYKITFTAELFVGAGMIFWLDVVLKNGEITSITK